MKHSAELRRCLMDCDVPGIRRLWAHVAPHLPQPANDEAALITLHIARTQAESVPFHLRAYSHRWCIDHGHPSGLPDNLKPAADRIYPCIAEGVGIAVKASSPERQKLAMIVRGAMEDAVQEAYADRKTDPDHVRERMFRARAYTLDKLIG